ncbi:WD40-repeat-containing domain protein [Suillus paluster]|uniref:WD40-repeat-containing domain protein n=1 Tax=Suillus paluster TaxID=48578 RepID=UPI001B86B956|nr:WD40-repeat-containing domain protein [Suillus paluster]KAG1724749.1 WD40-repeat-containing domain protein [Suillus paluster]
MISRTDDGFSDADIQGLKFAFSQSCSTTNGATTSSGLEIAMAPANYQTGWQSHKSAGNLEQQISLGGIWTGSPVDVKGKGVARSLDWHLATMASNDREREGPYLICSAVTILSNSFPAPLPTHPNYGAALLESLPRSVLARLQRRMAPLLQFDVVGSLPIELSLLIFTHLSAASLLTCSLVSKRWHALATDQALWRRLCYAHGWEWRTDVAAPASWDGLGAVDPADAVVGEERDEDEGMGDEEEDEDEGSGEGAGDVIDFIGDDSVDWASMPMDIDDIEAQGLSHFLIPINHTAFSSSSTSAITPISRVTSQRGFSPRRAHLAPDYKLLHQTHILLHNRFCQGAYRRRTLPCADTGGHTAAVYCLWLWTYPAGLDGRSAPLQVLFTGSKDRTVREWDLRTDRVRRVVGELHESSVLSLCISSDFAKSGTPDGEEALADGPGNAGLLVSGGSDRRVVVWDLGKDRLVKVLQDHLDSVLCVRVDSGRLVTCSKDRTVRTYAFPSLKPQFVFRAHRAAVNAVSVVGDVIVSGSGDRSVRVWNANTGALISTFEEHHARGIASIEFRPPYLLSGSSDMHLRMFDIASSQGWSTNPDTIPSGTISSSSSHAQDNIAMIPGQGTAPFFLHASLTRPVSDTPRPDANTVVCHACGSQGLAARREQERHTHLVRSVALGEEFAVSGSYDLTIKVWDRKTGALVADLTGGHTGRIFCVGFDCTKIVSCGEDQRICIWDFSHGIDTSFIKL